MLATLEPEGVTQSRANQDGQFFADEPTNIIVMAEEVELPVAEPHAGLQSGPGLSRAHGALKVMQFIMRRPDVFPQDFHRLWRRAHDEALAASPYANDMFRKIVVSKRSRVNDNDAAARAHFKMVDPPVYDLVVSLHARQHGAGRRLPAVLRRHHEQRAGVRRLVGVVLPLREASADHRRRAAQGVPTWQT